MSRRTDRSTFQRAEGALTGRSSKWRSRAAPCRLGKPALFDQVGCSDMDAHGQPGFELIGMPEGMSVDVAPLPSDPYTALFVEVLWSADPLRKGELPPGEENGSEDRVSPDHLHLAGRDSRLSPPQATSGPLPGRVVGLKGAAAPFDGPSHCRIRGRKTITWTAMDEPADGSRTNRAHTVHTRHLTRSGAVLVLPTLRSLPLSLPVTCPAEQDAG